MNFGLKCRLANPAVGFRIARTLAAELVEPDEHSTPIASATWNIDFYAFNVEESPFHDPPSNWARVIRSRPLHHQRSKLLDFSWGAMAPHEAVPADYFAVVATCELSLPAGSYRFWTLTDDGVRVFINGEKRLDSWTNRSHHSDLVDFAIGSGSHRVRVEYYELTGHAELRFGILKDADVDKARGLMRH